jgi:hypothetical protein
MRTLAECETIETALEFEREEEGCVIRFSNPRNSEVRVHQIDGDVFEQGDPKRCDWLFIDGTQTWYYVELKSSDIDKAYVQLESTITHIPAPAGCKRKAIVVFARLIPRFSSTIQTRQRAFLTRLATVLLVQPTPHIVNV